MTQLSTIEHTELDPSTGEPRYAHIVAGSKDEPGSGTARVLDSRINGTPLEALCGHVFVATRDARQYPICSRCVEIREGARPDQDPSDIPS